MSGCKWEREFRMNSWDRTSSKNQCCGSMRARKASVDRLVLLRQYQAFIARGILRIIIIDAGNYHVSGCIYMDISMHKSTYCLLSNEFP